MYLLTRYKYMGILQPEPDHHITHCRYSFYLCLWSMSIG